jgi:hypothetical protein
MEIPTPGERHPVGQVLDVSVHSGFFYTRPFLKYTALAAALAVVLLLGIAYPLAGPGKAVASVALEINSGIELMINRESKVIRARGAGEGTDLILSNLDLKGLDVYGAIELILEDARTRGILGDSQILILASVVLKDEEAGEVVNLDKLRCAIYEDMAGGKVPGLIIVSEADEGKKQQAESHQMTLNSYLVYERCRLCNLDVQADLFREGGAARALEGSRVTLPCLFPGESLELKQGEPALRSEETEGGRAVSSSPCGCEGPDQGGGFHEGQGPPASVTGKTSSQTESRPDCSCLQNAL